MWEHVLNLVHHHHQQVDGGREMEIRSADPRYMQHVERFWGKLLPLLQPYFYSQGGPILMLQVCVNQLCMHKTAS